MGSDTASYPIETPHLNPHNLVVKSNPRSGRGVYATNPIPRGPIIEISPVLLFTPDEYLAHGKHTILDSYTFVWKDKRRGGEKMWALALGLGSLFNHSQTPNVSFHLDYDTMAIRYTASQFVKSGDELLICYGREEDMWWNKKAQTCSPPPRDDWSELSNIELTDS